jgi:hypothetical protein
MALAIEKIKLWKGLLNIRHEGNLGITDNNPQCIDQIRERISCLVEAATQE